jgi:hypothetical protein
MRPSVAIERILANGRVVVTGYVIEKRISAGNRVVVTVGVDIERIRASGRVFPRIRAV